MKEKAKNFLKKRWPMVMVGVFIFLFMIAGVPLLINWAFTSPAVCDFFVVNWEAKDALSYYGSVLGFIGTAIFSGLALWQNHIIKTESDRRAQIAEKMEQQKHLPILTVSPQSSNGNCMNLSFGIRNLSENVALDVVISKVQIINNDGTEFWTREKEQKITHITSEIVSIQLNNPSLTSIDQVFYFRLTYKDKFGESHSFLVEGKQMGKTISNPKFVTKKI